MHFLCRLWNCVTSYVDGNSDLCLQNSVLAWKTWLLFLDLLLLYILQLLQETSFEYKFCSECNSHVAQGSLFHLF